MGDALYVAGFHSDDSGRVDAIDPRTGAPIQSFGIDGTLLVSGLVGGFVDIDTDGTHLYVVTTRAPHMIVAKIDRGGEILWSRGVGPGRAETVAVDAHGIVMGGTRDHSAWDIRTSTHDDEDWRWHRREAERQSMLFAVTATSETIYALGWRTSDDGRVSLLEAIAR